MDNRSIWRSLVSVLGVSLVSVALADEFYAAMRIECDRERDTLTIYNTSAYNELGVRQSDERNGIFVPDRNWPQRKGAVAAKQFVCRTKGSTFRAQIWPVFANISDGDTLELEIVRNEQLVLRRIALDSDSYGTTPNSYVRWIQVGPSGDATVELSCRNKVQFGTDCLPSQPNNWMERTR
jgi:hypothetical protein